MLLMARSLTLRGVHSDPSSLEGMLPGHVEEEKKLHEPLMMTKRGNNLYTRGASTSGTHRAITNLQNYEYQGSVIRSKSAQSLPVPSNDIASSLTTPYEREIYLLKNDLLIQKDVTLGRRIGFYKLGKELGAGNFSKVKLGIHVLTREKVAVKLMDKSKMDQKAQRLLAREIQAMEELHHPHIIRLFECVETMTRTFLVMEYAGGGELYAFIREKGKLTEEECKPLFAQIVSAVAHMHTKHIVHRDIKAENVIFLRPGFVKLADFGFSCKMKNDEQLRTFCGSPPYAAPELFRDEEYCGPMVDVWAIGVLLYFMLVGNTPFRGETVADLRQNILKGFFDLPENLSSFAQLIISRMLEMNPEKRMTIFDVKRTFWLRECSFAKSYVQCKVDPNEEEFKKNQIAREVRGRLDHYGISEEMLKEAYPKGPTNAIVGTYRIILYQVQVKGEEERQRIKKEEEKQRQEAIRKHTPMLSHRSKTCSIF